jgi:hypothetical protein
MKKIIIPVFVIVAALTIVSCSDHQTTTKETTIIKTDSTKVIKDTTTKSDYNPATPATQNAPY